MYVFTLHYIVTEACDILKTFWHVITNNKFKHLSSYIICVISGKLHKGKRCPSSHLTSPQHEKLTANTINVVSTTAGTTKQHH